jgi:5-oxoprolinase (ATP-hydrolysing)
VVGGNVETSQRVVDVLLAAMGRAAASQGTMNNLAFGDERFGYYETIGGGAGAGPGFAGASGVHVHMTNTRITDPEVLESRMPVIVRRFSLRRGSGGRGRHAGGDGLVRELEFTAPVTASILSERRTRAPFGLAGGAPGATGRNLRIAADGSVEELPGRVRVVLAPGERLRIETPGGGGYGAPTDAG